VTEKEERLLLGFWSAVARARVLKRAPLARRRRRSSALPSVQSSTAGDRGDAPMRMFPRISQSKHQFGSVAGSGANVSAGFNRPSGGPFVRGVSITRACGAAVAYLTIAMLVVAIPLAAPVLADRALAMIGSDRGGRVAPRVTHHDGGPGPGDSGRHSGASQRETRSK